MLQQILDDMHVDPDILEALNDEQKKILFLKMREEQVRRWKEREENEDREGRPERPRAKKASYKKVSWLLGCDGDVHVCIIGEEEELKSPKHILAELRGQNGTNLSKAIRFQTSEPLRSSQNNQKDHMEGGKSGIELLLEKTKINHPDPTKQGGDENLRLYKDEADSSHSSDSIVSRNNDLRSDESVRTSRGFSIAERLNQRVLQRSNKEQLHLRETPCSQTVHAPEKEVLNDQEINYSHGGRVAQLRRNFNAPNAKTSVPCVKPPIPTKPAHLLTAASVR